LEIIRNNIKSISNQTASCNPAPQDTWALAFQWK
jgi:hypothetical protein